MADLPCESVGTSDDPPVGHDSAAYACSEGDHDGVAGAGCGPIGPLPHRGASGIVVDHDDPTTEPLREKARNVEAGPNGEVRSEAQDPFVVHEARHSHPNPHR